MGGTLWDAQSGIGSVHYSLEFSAQISMIYSWKTMLVANLLPFFPLGIKPLDRDTLPFIPLELLGMRDPIPKIPEEGMRWSFEILELCSMG